jgi:uncharacterized protein with von Willebrand factor type A (vWA) domain
MTYPFASLAENLAAFCDTLRKEHGFRVGHRELQDAARALLVIPIGNEQIVRDTLRPILGHTLADVLVFDRAFDAFFRRVARDPQIDRLSTLVGDSRARGVGDRSRPEVVRTDQPGDTKRPRLESVEESHESDREARDGTAVIVGLRYSPLDSEGDSPELVSPDPDARGAARAFVNRLQTGLSRRWRSSPRGRRFDLRRTLRGSLHTGGEPVLPHWRARLKRRPRFAVIVDGSRSMGSHAQVALQWTTALASATRNLEAFTFSTALERVTYDVLRAAGGEPRRLPPLHHAWGGGTSLGACLHEFLRRYGSRLLGPETVVIVASDGLDVGDPGALRDAMARLHRLTAGIIWLNPLLETEGYEPTAQGMRIARPYVTTLAWVAEAADLLRLSRAVRLRT